MKKRCPWADPNDPLYLEYHDKEWGVPVHDDQKLFEFLVLEGAQAGLSWKTILNKRENYRRAFAGFSPDKVAAFDNRKVEKLLADPGIVRNPRKIESAVANARALLAIQKEYGSFDSYIWSYVDGNPICNMWKSPAQIPVSTPEAKMMSSDLVKKGFRFVGPTICYAYMQAIGMVNDHLLECYRHKEIAALQLRSQKRLR
ncbi:MAG: DNA-3-methyladenine glycosylase I [Methanobacteriota archaeon]|nr:MAG: DNA-3-methyladenine glycosylase I [Euryarchaeota archaeon]